MHKYKHRNKTLRDTDNPKVNHQQKAEDQHAAESGPGEDLKKYRGEKTPRETSETHKNTGQAPLFPLFVPFPLVTPTGPVSGHVSGPPPLPALCAQVTLPARPPLPCSDAGASFTPMGLRRDRPCPSPRKVCPWFPHLKLPRRTRSLPPVRAGRGGRGWGG